MRHRVFVMFELTDAAGATDDRAALSNLVANISRELSYAGTGLAHFRSRIVHAQSIEDAPSVAAPLPEFRV
jgi:hypothetical protein